MSPAVRERELGKDAPPQTGSAFLPGSKRKASSFARCLSSFVQRLPLSVPCCAPFTPFAPFAAFCPAPAALRCAASCSASWSNSTILRFLGDAPLSAGADDDCAEAVRLAGEGEGADRAGAGGAGAGAGASWGSSLSKRVRTGIAAEQLGRSGQSGGELQDERESSSRCRPHTSHSPGSALSGLQRWYGCFALQSLLSRSIPRCCRPAVALFPPFSSPRSSRRCHAQAGCVACTQARLLPKGSFELSSPSPLGVLRPRALVSSAAQLLMLERLRTRTNGAGRGPPGAFITGAGRERTGGTLTRCLVATAALPFRGHFSLPPFFGALVPPLSLS